MSEIVIKPFNPDYHEKLNEFREQIAVMYPAGIVGDHLKMVRSWIHVCRPGRAGFDPDNPGVEDTLAGWQAIDAMIEHQNVRGICHTHPPGAITWSPEDEKAQRGLAKANGQMYIWHVLHTMGHDIAKVICMHMPIPGQVVIYDLGKIECDVSDPAVLVPLPPRSSVGDGGEFTILLH
jgi:hypothetical protein